MEKQLKGLNELKEAHRTWKKVGFQFFKIIQPFGKNLWGYGDLGKDAPVQIEPGTKLHLRPVRDQIRINTAMYGNKKNLVENADGNKEIVVEVTQAFGLRTVNRLRVAGPKAFM